MKRSLQIILAVLLLGAAGFGIAQLDQNRKLQQNLAALDQERAALQKRIWELQKQNVSLENLLSRPVTVAAPAVADAEATGEPLAPTGGDAASADSRGRVRSEVNRFAALMNRPEVQQLMAIQQKAGLDGRYSSLFKQLQLGPADLEKFKVLLVEKQSAVADVMAAARSEGLTGRENREQIRQLVQDTQTEVEDNIRATLGDAAYAQYKNFEATQPQRNVVNQLDQRLSYSTTPLSDSQSRQLVQILAETSPQNGNAGRNFGGGGLALLAGANRGGPGAGGGGGGSTITSDTLVRAQGVLSAQQLSALQSLQQEQQAAAQLREQMRTSSENRARNVDSPTGGSPTPPRARGPGGG